MAEPEFPITANQQRIAALEREVAELRLQIARPATHPSSPEQTKAHAELEALAKLAEITAERDELRGMIEASDASGLFERLDAQHLRIAELEHALSLELALSGALATWQFVPDERGGHLRASTGHIWRPELTAKQRDRITDIAQLAAARQLDLKVYRQSVLRKIILAAIAEVCGPVEGP